MGATREALVTITRVVDNDRSNCFVGQLGGTFNSRELHEYIKKFGHSDILERLALLTFQVMTETESIDREKRDEGRKRDEERALGLAPGEQRSQAILTVEDENEEQW